MHERLQPSSCTRTGQRKSQINFSMLSSGLKRADQAHEQQQIDHLGELQGKLTIVGVACSKCDRRGRLSVAKLIAEHGADMRLPDLREVLAGDCPRVRATSYGDRC